MIAVRKETWALLDLLGIIILAAGAFFLITADYGKSITIYAVIMAIGIVLIILSSFFIFMDGRRLRKEFKEFQRFDEIRTEARKVPDDLKTGYVIDYTAADPADAIDYTPDEIEDECVCLEDDDDAGKDQ